MEKIRIVLAEDHHIVRKGVKALLKKEKDFLIVGDAGDGLSACQLVEHLQPDVLVLDLMLPEMNGFEVTRRVSKSGTAVVILSMYSDEAHVIEAISSGAIAYVLKSSLATHLIEAIRRARTGKRYLSPPLSNRAIENYNQKARRSSLDAQPGLTRRELQVLSLIARAKTNLQIANLLSISPRTVEAHRANLMRKLGLHNQIEVYRYALENEQITSGS